MDLFIYSDESGVFDKKNNEFYIYGGLIFLSKSEKDNANRLYLNAEKTIRKNNLNFRNKAIEIKASVISIKDKYSLYRSINKGYKFGIIINQEKVLDNIFNSKKDKQRYLDYAYKIGLKSTLTKIFKKNNLSMEDVENIYIFVDEHTTATNGKYELKEALEQEFKWGTYNSNYSCYFKPIFQHLKTLNVNFCNSSSVPLIRSSDIIANKIYHSTLNKESYKLKDKIFLCYLP